MTEASSKILVVGPSWVGDMVMSQVLYRYLAQARPGATIDVLAPAWSGPLVQRMPEVRHFHTMPLGHGELGLRQRWRVARALREQRYDQAIVLPNSFKSALAPLFAGIPLRTGWRGEHRYGVLNDLRRLDTAALPLMAQRFLALGLPAAAQLPAQWPQPRLHTSPEDAAAIGRKAGLLDDRPLLALCPGAEFGAAKRWPAPYYAELARDYLSRGWRVLLLGSENDRSICTRIEHDCAGRKDCINMAGRTTLGEVVDLLSLASAVVSNDSGLMHVAAAVQRPLLAIYGPTSQDFTPPLSPLAESLQSSIECAPCFARTCPLGHHSCMREVTPALAARKLDALLPAAGSAV